MPYYLDNAFLLDNPWITVVGCGGTGGFVAEGLCRLFQGREATIVLVDHDRGGAPQPAAPELLRGRRGKVQEPGPRRPAGQGLPASGGLLGLPLPGRGVPPPRANATPACPTTVTASSSAAPTTPPHGRAMAECLPGDPRRWLIDAGNDTNWGQVLIGNVAEPVTLHEPPFAGETCHLAPAPTLQRPDLLTAVSTRPPDVDCAAALDLTDQDPTINQMMASLVLQVVRRMVAGSCPFMGLYLDMEQGTVHAELRHPGGGGAGGGTRLRVGNIGLAINGT